MCWWQVITDGPVWWALERYSCHQLLLLLLLLLCWSQPNPTFCRVLLLLLLLLLLLCVVGLHHHHHRLVFMLHAHQVPQLGRRQLVQHTMNFTGSCSCTC
jgi:hypothetical protein